MTPADRPTLEVVAARAGVSRATASRVLRGSLNVSPEAREAVLRAAAEVSYTVNRAARSLVTRRSDTIAFLVAESQERTFADPYFSSVLRGAQAEAAAAGVQVVFVIASGERELGQFERYVAGGHVDGVLLVSVHGDDDLARTLESLGVPTVLNGRPLDDQVEPGVALFSVDADNVAGARRAAEELIDRGCRRIATITGPLDMCAGQDRLSGFRAALSAAGRDPDRAPTSSGDFSLAGGRAAMTEILAEAPDVDGVFVANDLMALGALRALSDAGRRVPEDVRLIGFDDVREAELSSPSLTTVRQPLEDLGRTMTRVLLARVNGDAVEHRTVLPISLVRRASA